MHDEASPTATTVAVTYTPGTLSGTAFTTCTAGGAAANGAVLAFAGNAGQVCTAGSRLLVADEIHDQLLDALVAASAAMQPGVMIGQLTTEAQFHKVQSYLETAEREGALLATGGKVAELPGWYIEPTIYSGVTNQMRIAREEIFGPVLSVIRFGDEDEAIAIANDSDYGLAAGIWTRDLSRGHRVASRLDVGQVYVNEWQVGVVETPFGGYKQSGYGREKGIEALLHYTQLKCVTVKL